MEIQNNNQDKNKGGNIDAVLASATKLSPLDLNGIKLDVQHTVLTPDYLEGLINKAASNS